MLNPAFLTQPPFPLLDRSGASADYPCDYANNRGSSAGHPAEGENDRALNLNILIRETLEGHLIAKVLEFPEWVVQATNRQEAMEKIGKLIRVKLQQEEIIPLKVDLLSLQPTMQPKRQATSQTTIPANIHRFAGMFKDDPDFQSIHQQILKEKETIV